MNAKDRIIDLRDKSQVGRKVEVFGWVRTFRNNQFIALNDGSCVGNLQVVVNDEVIGEETRRLITTGAALRILGDLVESQGKGQETEVIATEVEVLGACDAEEYPIQMKRHSMEFLREKAHLRFRTSTFGAVFRIRHAMTYAIHKYFNDNGFYNLHTPIITASDAEGAGEMFRVTTLPAENPPRTDDGAVDFSQDFFGKESNLTVSGQLEAELGAMALGKVYTFGPT
ncbi:MAG: asparagine--tRNA ligase, partial [Flavobacteriales bacterium]|nr:asparagine--tRNA ligase [Flavobacteriales bacterium]